MFEFSEDWLVKLVHSQTPDGLFCAQCLNSFAAGKGISSHTVQVNELTYSDSATFNRGLGRMVRVLAEEIRSGRQAGEVSIAATGGFKAEIAVANLVGALLGVPVYYIYEQFKQLIRIEPVPIVLAPGWLKEGPGRALLEKISEKSCLPSAEVSSLVKADGRLEMLVEMEEVEGREYVCANVLGELAAQVLASPNVDWPQPCDDEPEKKVILEGTEHHRPKGWEKVIKILSGSVYVKRINYEENANKSKNDLRPAPGSVSDILVSIFDGKDSLGLRVQTTAQSLEQRRQVFNLLKRKTGL
jgi:putative CRISPR-associated protein (TIGR02619 family)